VPWLALGVVALIVGFIALQGEKQPAVVAEPTSTTVAVPKSTTSVAPTTVAPSTTSAPPSTRATTTTMFDPWNEVPVFDFSEREGDYRTGQAFFAQFRVSLPGGWTRAFHTFSDIIEISPTREECETQQSADACSVLITVIDPVLSDVAETVSVLRSLDGVDSTEPVPIELGGASGVRFDMTTTDEAVTVHVIRDGGRLDMHATRVFSTHVLDVDGTPWSSSSTRRSEVARSRTPNPSSRASSGAICKTVAAKESGARNGPRWYVSCR
jgi:hypothetical protein